MTRLRDGRVLRGATRLPQLKGDDIYSRRFNAPDHFCIYAYLDADRSVLYVGRTACMQGRNAEHHQHSAWYSLAAEVRVLWMTSDRREALAAEAKAIRELAPAFNVAHNRRVA